MISTRVAIIISPNYKDYADRYLAACMTSVRQQTHTNFSVFLVDNESSETSMALLQSLAPEAEIIRRKDNDGFAGGNNAALELVLQRDYEFVFLLNMDTVVEVDCLERLIEVIRTRPQCGALQARLMLYPEQTKINSLGNETHFLGFGYARGYKETYTTEMPVQKIAYPSGAAVLLRTDALKKVGLFDEELWMYNEDQDLGWRLWLAGYECLLAPRAVVYHKYEFSRSIKQYYWLDRNRLIVLYKNYHWLTLMLIFPALVIMEAGLLLFALRSGYVTAKLKVWRYFFSIKHWRLMRQKRRVIQSQRVRREKEIVALITGRIWYQEIDSLALRIANIIFGLYWQLVTIIIRF